MTIASRRGKRTSARRSRADGVEIALEEAVEAAGGRDVSLGGGAETAQQYLRARLIDEMEIHVMPTIPGGGSCLFESLDGGPAGYQCVGLVSSIGCGSLRLPPISG